MISFSNSWSSDIFNLKWMNGELWGGQCPAVKCDRLQFEAACVLLGLPLWYLKADLLAAVYHRRAQYQNGSINFHNLNEIRWKFETKELMFSKWKERLAQFSAGYSTIEIIRPVLWQWVECKRPITFQLVQVLSGHGCFGKYLRKKFKKETNTTMSSAWWYCWCTFFWSVKHAKNHGKHWLLLYVPISRCWS